MTQKVYINPEYVDFVNPIIGEMEKINYQPWDVIKKYEEQNLLSDDTLSVSIVVYDLKQNGFFLKAVREQYLISIEDMREEKLQQLLDKNI